MPVEANVILVCAQINDVLFICIEVVYIPIDNIDFLYKLNGHILHLKMITR